MRAAIVIAAFVACPLVASYHNIVGFHLGPGGNHNNVETYLRQLDAAKVPFSIKDVDEWGTLKLAVQLREASGIDHTIIWRSTQTDAPPYDRAPDDAASAHWDKVKSTMPDELVAAKDQVWLEVINEPDQTKCAWLANFSTAISKLVVGEGWRIFNLGWSTGTPWVNAGGGPNCYEDPATIAFLKYAATQNGTVGIAVHEYSLSLTITNEWPYLLGRLHYLFDACDNHGIARPPVAITEWGWTPCDVKLPPEDAIADIDQVMRGMGSGSYTTWAPHLRAAMIWYLGPWSCDISDKADQLVLPVTNYSISSVIVKSSALELV